MKSGAHQDSIMIFSRIGWTAFPFLTWVVFPGKEGKEMERDTVMIWIMMDANTNWVPFFSPSVRETAASTTPLCNYHIKEPFKFLSDTLQRGDKEED